MTHPALEDALRRKAEDNTAAIWREARAQAEKCRDEAAHAIEVQRSETAQELSAAAKDFANAATVEAQGKVRTIRTAMKIALADHLHKLAREALPQFRVEEYGELFAALAQELPSCQWPRVRMNPADQGLARTHFPQAQIVHDEGIVGGMEVDTEEGRIRISNTLETRLEAAWPDLLPGLMSNIFEEFTDYRPST